ncbi:hypothetical protein SeMB42_g01890 [Synchytrium endobioticum]|uniref:Uncharacterized protein n=2 Tax=Synchytrium endobioticum TaxID=286115 RepID=A0A507DKY3_9FUNG|nr:hypothetical protein SeMB42_g01890 [Synchytrium endobioticum]
MTGLVGSPSHATSFCPDAQLVPSTVWRLKSDTSPALFVHPVGVVQDVQPQPRVIVHRDRNSRQHMNANFYSYCLTRGVVQEYMLPPWLHAAWTAVPLDEWLSYYLNCTQAGTGQLNTSIASQENQSVTYAPIILTATPTAITGSALLLIFVTKVVCEEAEALEVLRQTFT